MGVSAGEPATGYLHNREAELAKVQAVIAAGNENLVILGTRQWSQQVVEAARDPVDDPNVAYTFHFYSATHSFLHDELERAAELIPVVVTEWGTCAANGNGALDLAEAARWQRFMEAKKIWDMNWSVFDKPESCSALQPGAPVTGGWADAQLTESGRWVRASLRASAGLDGPTPTIG